MRNFTRLKNEELLDILSLSENATAIYTTADIVIQAANDAMISFWGKDRSVIGMTFDEAIPELHGQPFFGYLQDVWRTGITYEATAAPATLRVDDKLQTFYFDFKYRALKHDNGEMYAILHTANDVTSRVLGSEREKWLDNELAEADEELSAANEELETSKEELLRSQNDLQLLNQELESRVITRTHELEQQKALTEKQRHQLSSIVTEIPVGLAVLTGEDRIVEWVNDAMLKIWDRDGLVIDRPLLEIMPEIKEQEFPIRLHEVYTTGIPFSREDAIVDLVIDEEAVRIYVDYSYIPLRNIDGRVDSILVLTVDVTERALSRIRDQELTDELNLINEELTSSNEELIRSQEKLQKINNVLADSEARFRNLVMKAPVAIAVIRGEDLVFESVNDEMLKLLGKPTSIIGKPYIKALPEMKDQPYYKLLRDVYRSGHTHKEYSAKGLLTQNGKLTEGYYDYVYQPITDDNGVTNAVMAVAANVTDSVVSRLKIQELNQELAAINEELLASNEEINASNEELSESQKQLQRSNDGLMESETRFRNLVRQAPVGICIIRASDLCVVEVNDSYLELAGKTREQTEKRNIWDAVPEAKETYKPILDGVINTGVTFSAVEHELMLIRKNTAEKVFIDFVYEPIKLYDGTVDAIMVLALDVTDKVLARRNIEEMAERIRLAVEAAETGTFDLDLVKGIMLTSPRFDAIFGFDHHVSWKEITDVILPADREQRVAAHELSYKTGKLFYEARVTYPDRSIHWVRVQGQVYFDNDKKPLRILGTLIDITQFKRLQQQKDDFISIASHELKTPITSLKASLQLLERMKDNPSATALPKLIEQSARSMRKVSDLIDDLLNVSRANADQLKLNKSTFTVAEMLNNCCNHVRSAGKYNIQIEGDEKLQIYADEHAIDQVVVNLVNNAVKYAPDSLDIVLSIKTENGMAKISVSDTGPGIPPEKIPHLFDRFYQADASGYQRSGLGLGLYISSEIIKRHGGQMGVNSELGKGSTFWFTLPLK